MNERVWQRWARNEMEGISAEGRRRTVRDFDARGPAGLLPDGREVISFASNDYLGLTAHPAVIAGARAALDRWGAGSGSARLIVGSRPVHSELEAELAAWKNTEAAVLFPNGFAANLGVLQTFGGRDVVICSDELNHASIIDGCRMARARVEVYPHKDLASLRSLLEANDRTIVVTDTVFSMDGDAAPIDDIADLCFRHGSLLVVDEAHAVLGPFPDLDGVEAVHVGTLSKFLGAAGGFAAGTAFHLHDRLVTGRRRCCTSGAEAPSFRRGRPPHPATANERRCNHAGQSLPHPGRDGRRRKCRRRSVRSPLGAWLPGAGDQAAIRPERHFPPASRPFRCSRSVSGVRSSSGTRRGA